MTALDPPASDPTSVGAAGRHAPLVLVALIAVLAFALRFFDLGTDSFWADEFWSLQGAKLSLREMLDWTAGDVHPPLYYAVLHGWTQIAGTSEAAVRAPSACFGAATVVILMLAAWRAGPLVACGAGLLVALNGAHIAFSQEARMYPLVGCLALVACVALGRFIARPGYPAAAFYAVSLSALLYTDYVGFLLGGIHAATIVAYAIKGRHSDRGFAVGSRGALALAAVGVAFIPWWQTFFEQVDRVAFEHIPDPTWAHISHTMSRVVGLQVMGDGWLLIAAPLLVLGVLAITKRSRDPMLICIATLALVPALQILISFGRQPIFDLKRALPFAGGFAFLLALGVGEGVRMITSSSSELRRYAGSVALFLLTLPAGLFLIQGTNRSLRAPAVEDWRLPAAEVETAGLPVYVWREYLGVKLGVYAKDAELRPISLGDIERAQDGFVPIPRGSAGNEVFLLFGDIAGAGKPAVDGTVAALKPYFATVSHNRYVPGGVETYRLRAYSTSDYNVAIFGMAAPERWGTDPDGHLMTDADEAIFRSRAILDFDGDNRVDVDFRLHIEYQVVEGTPATLSQRLSADGITPFTPLAALLPGNGDWQAIDVPIADGSPVPAEFALTRGLHVRSLELRRYEIAGGDVLRRETDIARQWFLRPDGYLETAVSGACMRLDSAASEARVTYEYLENFVWREAVATAAVNGRAACLSDLGPGLIIRRIEVEAR